MIRVPDLEPMRSVPNEAKAQKIPSIPVTRTASGGLETSLGRVDGHRFIVIEWNEGYGGVSSHWTIWVTHLHSFRLESANRMFEAARV